MLDKYFPLYVFLFITTFTMTILIERKTIPYLKKHAKQPIYSEGPKWHSKKSGTPTMGGIAFIISISLSLLIAALFTVNVISKESFLEIIISGLYALSNAAIGIFDDKKKLKKSQNLGLTPGQKLAYQFLSAVIFLLMRNVFLKDDTTISFSFGSVDLGLLYYPTAIIVLLGIVNCANLTDGIDGLASSVAFSIGISLLYVSAALNVECGISSSCIIAATVAFLIFNLHPAKIFMGDTGSLFLGALISSCGFLLKNPLIIISIAGVYVLEGISVILQVIYFKFTRRRLFKMAPIHHHLERCGWSENRICIVAMICTFIFSIPAYIFYLP